MVERVLCKHEVVGSRPSGSTSAEAIKWDKETCFRAGSPARPYGPLGAGCGMTS